MLKTILNSKRIFLALAVLFLQAHAFPQWKTRQNMRADAPLTHSYWGSSSIENF